jgi:hypothetical protein
MTSTPHRIARWFRHDSWWDVLFFAAWPCWAPCPVRHPRVEPGLVNHERSDLMDTLLATPTDRPNNA